MAEQPFEVLAQGLKQKYAANPQEPGMIVWAYNHVDGLIELQAPNEQVLKGINADDRSENGYVYFVEPVPADGEILVEDVDDGDGGTRRRLKHKKLKPEQLRIHPKGDNWHFLVYKFGTSEPQRVRFNWKTHRLKTSSGYVVEIPKDRKQRVAIDASAVAVIHFVKKHIEGYENLYAQVAGDLGAASKAAQALLDAKAPRAPMTYKDIAEAKVGGRPPAPDSDDRRKTASKQAAAQAEQMPPQATTKQPALVAASTATQQTSDVTGETRWVVPFTDQLGNRTRTIYVPIEAAERIAREIATNSLTELPEDPTMKPEIRYARHLPKANVKAFLKNRFPAGAIITKELIETVTEGKIHPLHADYLGVCNHLYGVMHDLRTTWYLEPDGYRIEEETRTYVSGTNENGEYVHTNTVAYRAVPVTKTAAEGDEAEAAA